MVKVLAKAGAAVVVYYVEAEPVALAVEEEIRTAGDETLAFRTGG
jgi:hypothetical protein